MKHKVVSSNGADLSDAAFSGIALFANASFIIDRGVYHQAVLPSGRFLAGRGCVSVVGKILTETDTGQRWKLRWGRWVRGRATKSVTGRAKYEKRYKNGMAKC